MQKTTREIDFYGKNSKLKFHEDNCSIYHFSNEHGKAVLSRYDIFPGIALVFNDVHCAEITIGNIEEYHNVLEINHCKEECIEFATAWDENICAKSGDMIVNTKSGVKNYSIFPTNHYHGATIEIDFDVVMQQDISLLADFEIDLQEIKHTFEEKGCVVYHKKSEFEHLFSELYSVPERIRTRYYKIKIMEILLFLSVLQGDSRSRSRYFSQSIVSKVKEVQYYMVSHLDERFTIASLAEMAGISQTNFKNCFREIYGNSVYSYLKEYKMHRAAEFLRSTDLDIMEIAGIFGYDNASKFSSGFKSVMGITPREYKKMSKWSIKSELE